LLHVKKAGHAGTLDPNAEGVLPVCIGKATKIIDYLSDEKEYRAQLILGTTTDTEDITGKIVETHPVECSVSKLEKTLNSFVGNIAQTPPMYSAVKKNGVALYKLARQGKIVERVPRTAVISSIQIISYDLEKHMATIDVVCSKGTYIRTLCADIGKQLGCGGCMGYLIRLRSAGFSVDNGVKLDKLRESAANNTVGSLIHPIETVLPFKKVYADYSKDFVKNGVPVPVEECSADEKGLIFLMLGETAAGIYYRDDRRYKAKVMLL
jgi:tRNA pseudouridine55 synthase